MGGKEILIWLICQRRLLQWHPFVSLNKRICISASHPVYFLRKEFCFVLPNISQVYFRQLYKPSLACDPEILPARSEFYKSWTWGLYYISKTVFIFSVGHFGPALLHFLCDIHKKCPIVRKVQRISTALPYSFFKCWQTDAAYIIDFVKDNIMFPIFLLTEERLSTGFQAINMINT